jgi:acyl carrier protein
VPIGKPIPNATLYLLDGQQQPVPIGVPGEIYIGGAGIVPGYWRQPALTAERFVQLPWLGQQRLYRTGDLGRFLPDGSVQFLGRVDQQVKIRGYRVELGEIEVALKQAAGGAETAVLIHKNGAGIEQLVAYVAANEALPPEQTLRTRLKQQLPDYMVPARILSLATLPRTPNGKLDRAALPRPEAVTVHPTSAPPQNETEQTIAQIWGDLLQTAQVGRDDNFFALGGHSLLATQVMSRVQQAFSTVLPLQSLFNAPTVAALATAVAEAQQTAVSTTPPTIGRAARQAYRRQN